VFNGGELLVPAVQSLLEQDYENFEVLILDDGSTDGAVERLQDRSLDGRLRFFRHDNRGLSATLNRGLAEASGELVCRMDADDVAYPRRLRLQVEHLLRNPNTVLVGSQINRVIAGKVKSRSSFPLDHTRILKGLLTYQHVICHPSVMFRKSAAVAVGGYWTQGVAEDWDFFLKLSDMGLLENIPEVLLGYRYHDSGINATGMKDVRWNMRLATSNYERRTASKPEIASTVFRSNASLQTKLAVTLETKSLTCYRMYLRSNASRMPLKSALYALLAAILWPAQTYRRIQDMARTLR
jgi:glycosyltransferase involved in cell wall biosynthesis